MQIRGRASWRRDSRRQRTDRALARPRPLSGCLRARRRLQPAAGPARRRGHPVHPRPRDRAAVLAVARVAVHRPLPAEQRPGRAGAPRLGVPARASAPCPHLLAESGWHTALFGMQHETSLPARARLRRVRRVELVLRVRRRARDAVAARMHRGNRSCSPPGSSRRTGPIRGTATNRPIPTRSTCPTTCPTCPTCARTSPTSTARSRWPTPRWDGCSTP